MYCIECGTQIPDSSKFCSHCGQKTTGEKSVDTVEQQKKEILDNFRSSLEKTFKSCPREMLEGIELLWDDNIDGNYAVNFPVETSEKIANLLKTKILSGQYIAYSECNWLLDNAYNEDNTSEYFEIWKSICIMYIQSELHPKVDIYENWESKETQDYVEMVTRLVSITVGISDNGVEFFKEIIKSSVNSESLLILTNINEYMDSDFLDELDKRSLGKINDIKDTANKRYWKLNPNG